MIDGGTCFKLSVSRNLWRSELSQIVEYMIGVPPSGWMPCRLSIERLPDRCLTWGDLQELTPEVQFVPKFTRVVQLRFHERAFVNIDVDRHTVTVQAKAPELWGEDGLTGWISRWLDLFTWLTDGSGCSPQTAAKVGWSTRNLELCSDFVGIEFHLEDSQNFLGRATPHTHGIPDGSGIESIELGSRRSDVQLKIYNKSRQLRKDGVDPDRSVYAAAWRASDSYVPGAPIVRVELRLGPRALCFRVLNPNGDANGEIVDLRDPAALLDTSVLRKVWASEMARHRLYVPGRSRPRRCPTDPRWEIVQRAAGCAPVRLVRHREVQRLTHEERARRAMLKITRVTMEYAALHGHPEADNRDLARCAALAIERTTFDRGAVRRQIQSRLQFVAEECRDAAAPFRRLLDSGGTSSAAGSPVKDVHPGGHRTTHRPANPSLRTNFPGFRS